MFTPIGTDSTPKSKRPELVAPAWHAMFYWWSASKHRTRYVRPRLTVYVPLVIFTNQLEVCTATSLVISRDSHTAALYNRPCAGSRVGTSGTIASVAAILHPEIMHFSSAGCDRQLRSSTSPPPYSSSSVSSGKAALPLYPMRSLCSLYSGPVRLGEQRICNCLGGMLHGSSSISSSCFTVKFINDSFRNHCCEVRQVIDFYK